MNKTKIYSGLALFVIGLAAVPSAAAQVLGSDSASIDFSANKIPEGVSWSPHMSLGKSGLETKLVKAPFWQRYPWIQTQAVPVGIAWHPPTAASMQLNVRYTTPPDSSVKAYFRYSSDKVHWSSWYGMPRAYGNAADEGDTVYRVEVSLPRGAREKYQALMQEWQKSGPEWSSDEQEFCEWLAVRDPEYFSTEVPFIGYVQWRIEDAEFPKMGVGRIKMFLSWGVSGLHSPSPKMQQLGPDQRWTFDLCRAAGRCGQ